MTYDRAALSRKVPKDRAELFLGYVPSAAEVRATRLLEQRDERKGAILTRTAWRTKRDSQVVVEVTETNDADAAIAALVERLSYNQLAEVPERPNGPGLVCFAHPRGVAPASFFVRGNLEIAVMGAVEQDDVAGIATAIDARLSADVAPEVETIDAEEGARLALAEEEVGDRDVFVRIDIQGARARLDDDHRMISIFGSVSAGKARVRAARIGRPEKQSRGVRLK